jgi:hypothetical protein
MIYYVSKGIIPGLAVELIIGINEPLSLSSCIYFGEVCKKCISLYTTQNILKTTKDDEK